MVERVPGQSARTDDVHVLTGPVAGQHLAALREGSTRPAAFRRHARALGTLLTGVALGDLPARSAPVTTPLGPAEATRPDAPLVVVPVLRAGLGLLPGVLEILPDAAVGMVGLERDAETLRAREYYTKLPPLEGAWALVLEPMLATGGSASAAVGQVAEASRVVVLGVVATQTGIDRILTEHPGARIVTAALDPQLDDDGYIVPGLGDFGDRLYGTRH